MNHSFKELVFKATLSPSDTERLDSEHSLLEFMSRDYQNFLLECMKVFLSPEVDGGLRQATATMMIIASKESKVVKNDQNGVLLWESLQRNFKQEMKDELLALLIGKDILIVEATCDIVATVYVVELMFDGWPKFIDNLCDIIKDKKEDLIHVSLRILSRICDLLVNFGHQIDRRKMGNDTQGILGSLLMCIEAEVANKEVRTTALKALRLAAEFIGECLDRQDAREYVFKLLLVNLNLPDQETVALTYQLMIELVKAMYIYLDDRFISEIAGLSKKHIESRSNSVVIFVCEFWSAFAGEETYRKENMESGFDEGGKSKNFMQKFYHEFMPLILVCLQLFKPEDNETSNTPFSACVQALFKLNQCLGDLVIPMYMEFIDMCIKNNTPQMKIAALTSYRCMVRYISKMACYNLLNESFQSLIGLLEDADFDVRVATCRLLETIAEFQSENMLTETILKRYMEGFIAMIDQADEVFACSMCSIFEKLAEKVHNSNNQAAFFQAKIPDLVYSLLNCAFKPPRGQDLNLQSCACKTLISIVIFCFDPLNIQEFLEKFFDGLEKAQTFTNKDHRIQLLECMCLCMSMINYRARQMKFHIPKDALSKCYQAAVNIQQKERQILGEAIFLMGSVAPLLGQEFFCFMDDFLAHLREGIQNSHNNHVITTAFEALGNLSREVGNIDDNQIKDYFMPELLKRIKDGNVPLEDRVTLFTVIGDLCLGNIKGVLHYVQEILGNFESIFQAVCEMLKEKDNTMLELAAATKTKVIDSHMCFVHAIYQNNNLMQSKELQQLLKTDLKVLCSFVMKTTEKWANPSVDYVSECLALILDTILVDQDNFMPISRDFKIEELAHMLKNYDKDEKVRDTLRYYDRLFR